MEGERMEAPKAGNAAEADAPPTPPVAASAELPDDGVAAALEAAVVIKEIEALVGADEQSHPLTATSNAVLDVGDNEVVLLTKSDKAVSTNDTLEDLQRALTYEIIFSALFERKVLAIKRECEERKRAKRMKRKSIGRLFFSKRFFGGARKAASCRGDSEPELFVRGELGGSTPQVYHSPKTTKKAGRRLADEIEVASASTTSHRSAAQATAATKAPKCKTKAVTAHAPADDSVASTLSNSSGKNGMAAPPKRSLLVRAQTHTPAELVTSSSSSGNSKEPAHTRQSATNSANGNGGMALPASLLERTYDTASIASGYDNGTGAHMHTSTMADDSLTSLRDSIESLSFASSRYTVSFGGTEIIPEDTASLLYERARAARRLRVLEAKSISAQCSPIFPRHLIKSVPAPPTSPPTLPTLPATTPAPTRATHPAVPSITAPLAVTAATAPLPLSLSGVASAASSSSTPAPPPTTSTKITQTKQHIFPRQVSYTESMYGYVGVSADLDAAYTRYFSRQNTSEESANLTVSTMLNQSDSLSLHAPVGYASAEREASGRPFALADRYKSKSTSLLVVGSNGRSRPPPLTLPLPAAMAKNLPPVAPAQLATSNISHSEQLVDSTQINAHVPNAQLTSHPATLTSTSSAPAPQPSPASAPAHYHPTVGTTALGVDIACVEATTLGAFCTGPANGVIVTSAIVPGDTAKLNRMTSTSTGSSVAPTGCCATTKSSSRDREKQRFKPHWPSGQSGSDDEYRRRKRKYKRYHRCSDPVLVYPSPSGLQHCVLSMPPSEPIQFQYNDDFAYDMQIQMESDKNDDLEEIVPSSHRRHRRHRHHRHKKRHRHKKPKILVQDLETQVVKVIDPDDLPQRARWTIIATACLLLLMCLMLVGITLRMAPIIDDMGKSASAACETVSISFAISDCSPLLLLPASLI